MIHCGDCLDVMAKMPADSVDLIMTSPPYADARQDDYGGVPADDYVEWFVPRAEQMKRVLKPTGSFVLNIKEKVVDGERHPYVLDLILAMKRKLGFRWIEEYIWHKKNTMPGKWPHHFRDSWERVLHFTKTADIKIYQDAVRIPRGDWADSRLAHLSKRDKRRITSATNSKFGQRMANWVSRKLVYPQNVIHGNAVHHNNWHSAVFPEYLPEFYIKLFTVKEDTVLDPFVGSGTTYKVANRLGRRGIGIDIQPKYASKLAGMEAYL